MIENQRLDLAALRRIESQLIAVGFSSIIESAVGINFRGKENIFAVGRPQLTASFGHNVGELMFRRDRTRCTVEIRNPDLRPLLLRREKGKTLPIRRPARTIAILISDDFSFLTSSRRHDPDVR